ncbi:MAG: histidine kinase [Myxococcota bacterium]
MPQPFLSSETSLLRQPRFWLVQLAGWLLIQPLYFRHQIETAFREGLGSLAVLLTASSCVLAIACSSGLAAVYLRIPPSWLTGVRAIPVALGLSLLACVPWAVGIELVARATAFSEDGAEGFAYRFFFIGSILMVWWSGAFLWLTLSARVTKTQARALRAEALAHEAKLMALRAQLNPHFLFNSLNSVVGLIGTDPGRARQMVRDLAGLLRRALDSTKAELTTIGDELDLLAQYLRCESVRFRERLEVRVDVPDHVRQHAIPSMLLQPLVENAIKHGIKGTRALTLVIVGRFTTDRTVVIEVRNTGRLAGPTAPLRTPSARPEEDDPPGTGSGLRIVRERLAATYPESGKLDLFEDDGWVVARVNYEPEEADPALPRLQATNARGAA